MPIKYWNYLFGIRNIYTLSCFSIKFPLMKWTCNAASRNSSSRSKACSKMWTIQISNKYGIWCFIITSKNSKILSYSMNFLYFPTFNLLSKIRNGQNMGKNIYWKLLKCYHITIYFQTYLLTFSYDEPTIWKRWRRTSWFT